MSNDIISAKRSLYTSRREFLTASAVTTGTILTGGNFAYAAPAKKLRVGLIGCGGRGTGAAIDNMKSSEDVELYAMGDLFEDQVNDSANNIKNQVKDKVQVSKDRMFTGWDAYKKVLASGVDLVILATPPGFRPVHALAAANAGKHIFMEKPVAVDAPGVRKIMDVAKIAKEKRLGVVAGTQRRHQFPYIETIKRIHDGAIGEVVAAQCYWNQGYLWLKPRQASWTDVENQIRNWIYYTWIGGDHYVEQHIHNVDVINWVFDGHPESAYGMGGRQSRTQPEWGHVFDHFAVEYKYPNGALTMSMARQVDGTDSNVSERVVGTKGIANPGGSIRGTTSWRYEGKQTNPYEQEHADLVASILKNEPLNEAQRIAETTLTVIMGRMSAYTGKRVTWQQALDSQEDLMPKELKFGPLAVAPVPIPGKTQLV